MDQNTDQQKPDMTHDLALSFDWQDYQDFFDGKEVSEDDQRAFIEALWKIVIAFVDLGFDANPVEILCAQMGESSSDESGDLVKSDHTTTDNEQKQSGGAAKSAMPENEGVADAEK